MVYYSCSVLAGVSMNILDMELKLNGYSTFYPVMYFMSEENVSFVEATIDHMKEMSYEYALEAFGYTLPEDEGCFYFWVSDINNTILFDVKLTPTNLWYAVEHVEY